MGRTDIPVTNLIGQTITRIYNGTPDGNIINNTASIGDATALFMVTPDSINEWEVDFYLQLEITPFQNRLIKLNDSYVMDTTVVYPIPYELQGTGLTIYGAFTGQIGTTIEIYAIHKQQSEYSCDLTEVLDAISDFRAQFTLEQLRSIATDIAFALSLQSTNFGLGILSASLAPLTLATNPLLSSAAAVPAFAGATGILTPVTVIGLLP